MVPGTRLAHRRGVAGDQVRLLVDNVQSHLSQISFRHFLLAAVDCVPVHVCEKWVLFDFVRAAVAYALCGVSSEELLKQVYALLGNREFALVNEKLLLQNVLEKLVFTVRVVGWQPRKHLIEDNSK